MLQVKRLADRDGMTVSTWIRNVVTREVERRSPRPMTTRFIREDVVLQLEAPVVQSTHGKIPEQPISDDWAMAAG